MPFKVKMNDIITQSGLWDVWRLLLHKLSQMNVYAELFV